MSAAVTYAQGSAAMPLPRATSRPQVWRTAFVVLTLFMSVNAFYWVFGATRRRRPEGGSVQP